MNYVVVHHRVQNFQQWKPLTMEHRLTGKKPG